MSTVVWLRLSGSKRDAIRAEVSQEPPWRLRLFDRLPGCKRVYEEDDLFKALSAWRRDLEKQGISVLCQGSRINVRPSGMQREIGGGRGGYVHALGESPGSDSVVNIFETYMGETATVDEQDRFFQDWLKSI